MDVSVKTEIKKLHMIFNLKAVGVTLEADEPHLAASPDGIFSGGCGGIGLLKVKCSYKIHRGTGGVRVIYPFILMKTKMCDLPNCSAH